MRCRCVIKASFYVTDSARMVSIHDLREDFRLFRFYHPQYRLLFALLDLAVLLLKLAVIGMFLFSCWYIAARGFSDEGFSLPLAKTKPVVVRPGVDPSDSEHLVGNNTSGLAAERIALLKRIAGQPASHLVLTKSDAEPRTLNAVRADLKTESQADVDAGREVPAKNSFVADDEQSVLLPEATVVKVASLPSTPNYNVTVEPTTSESDIIFNGGEKSLQGYDWVVDQGRDNFTLQIALTVNRPFLVSFAQKLPSDLIATVFPERITDKGETQYSLAVGNFDSEEGAQSVLDGLPQSVKRYGAHVRSFGNIHDTVGILNSGGIQ